MRKALLAVIVAGATIVGLLDATVPAGAVDRLVVDYAVSVVSNPATVSPAGEVVEYRITVTNQGLAELGATVTDSTDGGTLVAAPAGCSITSGTTFTCAVSVPAGESIEIDALIVTPTNDADAKITNTATVVVGGVLNPVVDTDPGDNTDSAETTLVAANTTVGSSAFLAEGESLQFRGHVLTVLEVYGDSGGVQANLKDSVVTAGTSCGPDACSSEGLNVTFTDGEEGQRSDGLVEIDVFFGNQDPCRGVGNPDCYGLFYRELETETAVGIEDCGVENLPVRGEGPCLVEVYKEGELFHQVIRLYTDDPDILEPVKSLTGTRSV